MKMLSKSKMNILLALCLISITSIGFSSWVIVQDSNPLHIQGNIDVDNVINSSDYIKLKNAPSCFNYGERGFVDIDGNYVKNANMMVTYQIDIEKCKLLFSNIDNVYINISLKHSTQCTFPEGKGLFDSYTISNTDEYLNTNYSFESSITIENVSIPISSDEILISQNEYNLNFKIGEHYSITEETPSMIELSISYQWTLEDSTDYFKDYIYPIIYDKTNESNKLNFVLNASITGN